MDPMKYEAFIGSQIFSECQLPRGGKYGTLTCTTTGIEFDNGKKYAVYPWSEISYLSVSAVDRKSGTATVLVKGPTTLAYFYGHHVTTTEFETLERIATALAKPSEVALQVELLVPPELADVVDGTGWAPPVGSKVSITIDEEKLTLRDFESVEYVLPLTALKNIQIQGYTSTKNFGLGGFGFDLETAAKSIAFARIVNRLTTRVKTWVLVSIESNLGRATLLFLNTSEMPVRHLFRPAQDRALELSSKPQDVHGDDLVSRLERITTLHEKGVLSDEEFKTMKEKLLQ